mmetsp:Transcript_15879/g.40497  ORF Transcript_15879/g.40497 Transcript_15879/m.40497 type:complete len:300 (-) Transcript_15879:119-1018(-)
MVTKLGARRPSLNVSLLGSSRVDPGGWGVSPRCTILMLVAFTCVLTGLLTRTHKPPLRGAAQTNSIARANALSRYGAMACSGAPLCGILALETGLGPGYYNHPAPTVHGLWPQVAPWGSSPCIRPRSDRPRKHAGLPECLNRTSPDPDHVRWFVAHEWMKHGVCAGVANEDDFFAQICEISANPLAVMVDARNRQLSFEKTVSLLEESGFPVYNDDPENKEVLLSACATHDPFGPGYIWKLASVAHFTKECRHTRNETIPPTPKCLPSLRGPECETNAECEPKVGCARCSTSGFCTSRP